MGNCTSQVESTQRIANVQVTAASSGCSQKGSKHHKYQQPNAELQQEEQQQQNQHQQEQEQRQLKQQHLKKRTPTLLKPPPFTLENPSCASSSCSSASPPPGCCGDMSLLETEVFWELCSVRNDPTLHAHLLQNVLAHVGQFSDAAGGTAEDLKCAVADLMSQKPLRPLKGVSRGLNKASLDMLQEIMHGTATPSCPLSRAARHGHVEGTVEECVCFGVDDAAGIVSRLLLDEENRDKVLDSRPTTVGIACSSHPLLGPVAVVTFASHYRDSSRRASTSSAFSS